MARFILSVFGVFTIVSFLAGPTESAEQWSRFRGPNGQGVSSQTGLPTQWGVEKNIAWKTEIPGEGWSSPIVWDDHVFLTTATEDGKECHVIAVDRTTGKILWDKIVFDQEPEYKHPKNSYATPTPVTDGKHVFAVFGGGSFVALDFDGNIVWTNRELQYYSQHGLGTSPILYKDLLILAVNPSNREEPKLLGWQTPWDRSYLWALNKNTGKELWRGKRGMSRISHATPCIITVNGKEQILSLAGDVTQGFDPENGDLLWTVESIGEPCVPSPGVGDGLVYSTGSNAIRAVRPNGQGECTDTHTAWVQKRNAPMVSSFLYVKPCLYTTTQSGSFSACDAATGEFLWEKRLGGTLNPSPLYADGNIYVLSEQGKTVVLKPSEDPKKPAEIIAENELDEHALASITVAGQQLLIRTDNHLWCIGK